MKHEITLILFSFNLNFLIDSNYYLSEMVTLLWSVFEKDN